MVIRARRIWDCSRTLCCKQRTYWYTSECTISMAWCSFMAMFISLQCQIPPTVNDPHVEIDAHAWNPLQSHPCTCWGRSAAAPGVGERHCNHCCRPIWRGFSLTGDALQLGLGHGALFLLLLFLLLLRTLPLLLLLSRSTVLSRSW